MKLLLLAIACTSLLMTSCSKSGVKSCAKWEYTSECIDSTLIDPTVLCTDDYDPVCGCNGVTYGNACDAYRNGVTSFTKGECCP